MLYNFLLVVLIIDAIVLVTAILLQAGKGSGLAANFGGASSSPDAFIGIRQAGTILTKATWWCSGIFLGLAFVLQVMSTRASAPKSVLEKTFSNQPAPVAPVPGTTAPAIPLEPATGGTPAGGSATTPPSGGGAVQLSPAPAPATPPPATPKKK